MRTLFAFCFCFVLGITAVCVRNSPNDPDPFLMELEERVTQAYRESEFLSFEAEVVRRVAGEVTSQYLIEIEMTTTSTTIEVRDSEQVVLWLKKVVLPNETTMIRKDYSPNGNYVFADTCLSGSLQETWIGHSPPAEPPPYTYRIRDGTYLGLSEVDGKFCHQVRFSSDGVTQDYYINPETYLFMEWTSIHTKPNSEVWMTITRRYCYPEMTTPEPAPTLVSVKQEGDVR